MYEHNIRTPSKIERKNIIIYYNIQIGAIIQYRTYIIVVSRYLRRALGEIYTCPINNYNTVTTIYIYIILARCASGAISALFLCSVF